MCYSYFINVMFDCLIWLRAETGIIILWRETIVPAIFSKPRANNKKCLAIPFKTVNGNDKEKEALYLHQALRK